MDLRFERNGIVRKTPTAAIPDARQGADRIELVSTKDSPRRQLINQCLKIALDGLPLMYRKEIGQFAFTRQRQEDGGLMPVGESLRYGAITILGAALLEEEVQRPIFGGQTAMEYCGRMLHGIRTIRNGGDLALLAWAAAEINHPDAHLAFERLAEVCPFDQDCETVWAAWSLSALTAACQRMECEEALEKAHARMLHAFRVEGRLFPHWTSKKLAPKWRGHIACFADQVYPVQALARYHRVCGEPQALQISNQCAEQICRLQGSAGQWWWHYDVRNGTVAEGYPVYSVHQHAMAPMALFDLMDSGGAGGFDSRSHIARGVDWLSSAPETGTSLLSDEQHVIWRKVGRTDPAKLVRKTRAIVSRLNGHLRLKLLDRAFPAKRIDFECRPYEFGWMLYAWLLENQS
jgi:hypothetical protein